MATRIEITENELLDALASVAANRGPKDAKTVEEMSDATGIGPWTIRKALKVLHRQGRLTVHKAVRPSIAGCNRAVPAYTIAPKKK